MFFKWVGETPLKVGEMDAGETGVGEQGISCCWLYNDWYKFEMCIQRCMAIVTDGTACWVWDCEQDEPKFPHVC